MKMDEKKPKKMYLNEIKNEYNRWKIIPIIGFVLSVLSVIMPNLFEGAGNKSKIHSTLLIIFIVTLPLLGWFIKKIVKTIKNGIAYPQLEDEIRESNEKCILLNSKNELLENDIKQYILYADQLSKIIDKSKLMEVKHAYNVENDIFIVLPRKYFKDVEEDLTCALRDSNDGYLFGFFSEPILKEDGIHLKSQDPVNPMLLGRLKSSIEVKLRPTTYAIIVPKEN